MKWVKWVALATWQVALGAMGPASAQDADSLDRFLAGTRTLRADFHQELLDGEGNLIESASGTFSLKRPNRFRWNYAEPFEQQVVADSANLWIHDVELAQVTVAPLAGAIASSPAMLLSGDGAVRDGFEIVGTARDGTIAWISLTPKERGVDFRSIDVGLDAGRLAGLVLRDALGQVTSITFRDVMVNLDIEDDFFRFEPPTGTDVIGEAIAPMRPADHGGGGTLGDAPGDAVDNPR